MKTFNRFGLSAEEALGQLAYLMRRYPGLGVTCRVELPQGLCDGQVSDGEIVGLGLMRRGSYAGIEVAEGGLGRRGPSARQVVISELALSRGEEVPEQPDPAWYARQEQLYGKAISEDYASIDWTYEAYLIVAVSG
ncbi:MAG: hypothetical protein HDQ87_01820 [Clostridia bacterium]|nr:hypothetical protein [Clostridia bacterium]